MKVTISKATEYRDIGGVRGIPVESYYLEVESTGMEEPSAVVTTYLELKEKLDKAMKEAK